MKNLIRYLAFALMVGGVNAQSNLPACQGRIDRWNKCFGSGTTKNSIASYVGEYNNGLPNGQGTATFANGEKYVGEFKDGKYNGNGTLYSSTGFVTNQGVWVNQIFIRSATVQQATAPKTEIEKQSNLPACQGADASKWSNCFGTFAFDGGNIYVGEWKDAWRNGQGSEVFLDGTKYVGGFKYGIYSGFGTLTWPDGYKYIGEFNNGNYEGKGALYGPNGLVINDGLWTKGVFVNSTPVQQATAPNIEIERLRAEAEESKRKQGELETQLRITQQSNTQQSSPTNISQKNSKRIALVIGNANYASAPLKNPLNDAADISASLRQSGFEVIDQRNATLQEMTRGIREFGDKLLKSDVGLVYYSGHGLEVKGRNYLLPVNASMIREDEIAFQAIDANLILEKMNTAKKSVNILIVDACRDNPFARSFRSTNRGLAQMDAPTGTIVSFSTSPGKTASDGDGRNSPFTKNLVKAMMRADMPIEAMFKEVRKSVVEETKGQQTPWESSSLIGDFYFKVSK